MAGNQRMMVHGRKEAHENRRKTLAPFPSRLPIVRLSAGSPTRSLRHGNLKACLRVATKRLGTSLVDLLLDIILRFTTDKDDPPAVPALPDSHRPEAVMPDRDARAKLRIYQTIYRLNLSFANIVANCRALGESGILVPKVTRFLQRSALQHTRQASLRQRLPPLPASFGNAQSECPEKAIPDQRRTPAEMQTEKCKVRRRRICQDQKRLNPALRGQQQ